MNGNSSTTTKDKEWIRKRRCPICGEELPSFDRKHTKTKHPEFFRESRKWSNLAILSALSTCILLILNAYLMGKSSRLVFDIVFVLVMVNIGIELYIISKVIRVVEKYRETPNIPT